jgi:TrmH family RNA methyltransferase
VRVVLLRPEHPGNVGAAARGMKNLGFGALHLVAPVCGHLTPEGLAMAYGARDVLESARVHARLADALADARWVVGFAMPRPGRPAPAWLPDVGAGIGARARVQDVALLFGSEIAGLSNDDLAVCHQVVAVPTDGAQPSLNLAQAVLLACYELTRGFPHPSEPPRQLAPVAQLDALQAQLAETLSAIGFLHPPRDRHLLRDLRALLHRTQLDEREVRILRGILRQARWAHDRAGGDAPPAAG